VFLGHNTLATTWRLVALACGRVGDAQAPVQPSIDVECGPLIVLADHEDGDLQGGRKADEQTPVAGAGKVDAQIRST
jgi:hypothetical protein